VLSTPGLTDREITDRLMGQKAPQQAVNQACRALAQRGLLTRHTRHDGRIGNFPGETGDEMKPDTGLSSSNPAQDDSGLTEDGVKRALEGWLRGQGWMPNIMWQRDRGIDIDARRGDDRWIIEVKGCGSRQQMRVNYFLAVLGELLQRMDDEQARYSIALPYLPQFRRLWERLPKLAKSRTTITALFVRENGSIIEAR
jgi:hypothetical protein